MQTILAAAALAFQGGMISNSSPPPSIIAVPSPVPDSLRVVPATGGAPTAPPVPFLVDVVIASDGRPLYQGTLRLARGFSASYSQNRSEAPAVICPGSRSYETSPRSSLQVQLNQYGDPQDRTAVSVEWTRPAPLAADCERAGTRSVRLMETVTLGVRESHVLQGDAGLTVTLRRR